MCVSQAKYNSYHLDLTPMKERVAQYMHKITLYILGILHLSLLIKLKLQ